MSPCSRRGDETLINPSLVRSLRKEPGLQLFSIQPDSDPKTLHVGIVSTCNPKLMATTIQKVTHLALLNISIVSLDETDRVTSSPPAEFKQDGLKSGPPPNMGRRARSQPTFSSSELDLLNPGQQTGCPDSGQFRDLLFLQRVMIPELPKSQARQVLYSS
jgi:hypothetical protein